MLRSNYSKHVLGDIAKVEIVGGFSSTVAGEVQSVISDLYYSIYNYSRFVLQWPYHSQSTLNIFSLVTQYHSTY